jgi:hypothetical protein
VSCHITVTTHGVQVINWIYWTLNCLFTSNYTVHKYALLITQITSMRYCFTICYITLTSFLAGSVITDMLLGLGPWQEGLCQLGGSFILLVASQWGNTAPNRSLTAVCVCYCQGSADEWYTAVRRIGALCYLTMDVPVTFF